MSWCSGKAEHLPLARSVAYQLFDATRFAAIAVVIVRYEFTLHGVLVEAADPQSGVGDLSHPDRLDVFHELAASPLKPSVTNDTIDVMATRQFPRSESRSGRAVHFEIIEAKNDSFGTRATMYDKRIVQLMKYVDFISGNHAGGNYAAVSAFPVAHHFGQPLVDRHHEVRANGLAVGSRSC